MLKKYPTYVSHNQYGNALPSAISLRKNEVIYKMEILTPELKEKLHGVIGWIYLTMDELHQINNARHAIRSVDDQTMENLLKSLTKSKN